MLLNEQEKRWYCFKDNVVLIDVQAATKPSQKHKRNWGRTLLTALFCAIPLSNQLAFLFAYNQRARSTELNCPHCKSPAIEEADKTLRWKNKGFDTIFEYRCLGCGTVWQRWAEGSGSKKTTISELIASAG
jgi:hypothetical protein